MAIPAPDPALLVADALAAGEGMMCCLQDDRLSLLQRLGKTEAHWVFDGGVDFVVPAWAELHWLRGVARDTNPRTARVRLSQVAWFIHQLADDRSRLLARVGISAYRWLLSGGADVDGFLALYRAVLTSDAPPAGGDDGPDDGSDELARMRNKRKRERKKHRRH